MEYYCSFIKVDWLATCIALRVVGAVLGVKFAQSSSQWEARADMVPEEISQTPLNNNKQGNLD